MALARPIMEDRLNILMQPGTPVLAQVAVAFAVLLTTWALRRHTRLALRQLEPWQLADVGLTPDEASKQASRVFWKP